MCVCVCVCIYIHVYIYIYIYICICIYIYINMYNAEITIIMQFRGNIAQNANINPREIVIFHKYVNTRIYLHSQYIYLPPFHVGVLKESHGLLPLFLYQIPRVSSPNLPDLRFIII